MGQSKAWSKSVRKFVSPISYFSLVYIQTQMCVSRTPSKSIESSLQFSEKKERKKGGGGFEGSLKKRSPSLQRAITLCYKGFTRVSTPGNSWFNMKISLCHRPFRDRISERSTIIVRPEIRSEKAFWVCEKKFSSMSCTLIGWSSGEHWDSIAMHFHTFATTVLP